jgi:ABC-2 type transport system ATP-binding protein
MERAAPEAVRSASGGDVALSASGVRKRYGDRDALHDVALEARAGELVAVIGPNGAGKTTLLTILAGLLPPDGGVVSCPGGAGWVPQQPAVYGKLSVAENLRLFARLERVADVERAVERMLEETGLRERADDQVATLSGGNRQRVNVAVGLLSSPPVLLLDEPTAALDPRQRARMWRFVSNLAARGTAVVYSTHAVSEAERHADQVLVLADGERLFWGTPDELAAAVEPGAGPREGDDFEDAFVAFLQQAGH